MKNKRTDEKGDEKSTGQGYLATGHDGADPEDVGTGRGRQSECRGGSSTCSRLQVG